MSGAKACVSRDTVKVDTVRLVGLSAMRSGTNPQMMVAAAPVLPDVARILGLSACGY